MVQGDGIVAATTIRRRNRGYNARVTQPTHRPPSVAPLEPAPDEVRRWLDATADRIVRLLATLSDQPASDTDGAEEVAASAREDRWPSAASGTTLELGEALDRVMLELAPKSFNNAGPGFMAYIPGGGLVHSAIADLVACVVNRYTAVWMSAPALVQLEANVIRWFCRMFGYGAGSGGYLSSGGSMANLSAVVAARTDRLDENFLRGTIYASQQAHHSIVKATSLAGFPARNVRRIPVDAGFRMRVDVLERTIERDRADGFEPFLLVANAGSTDFGAVDPLAALADVAASRNLWLHVDAAYGGFFALTARGRTAFAGIERADSITLDPHKGLFLPYGTGCLVVRDVDQLHRAHSATADYMPSLQNDPDRPDFCALSPELSRDFRGLRVWLPIKMAGVEAFRDALDEKLDLARWMADELRALDHVEIAAEPELSILAFRLALPELADDEEADRRINRDLLAAINRRQRVFLSGTRLGAHFVIRICVLSFRTHRERMEMCLEDVRAAIDEVRSFHHRDATAIPQSRG